MERINNEENNEFLEGRNSVARMCVFLGLSCFLMLILRLQSHEIEANKKIEPSVKRLKLNWEMLPLVSSNTSLLTVSYLDSGSAYALTFYSYRESKDHTSMLAATSEVESIYEDPSWINDIFANLSLWDFKSEKFPSINQQPFRTKKPNGNVIILSAVLVSKSRAEQFKETLSGCFGLDEKNDSDRCYVALKSSPLENCITNNSATDTSWSCITPEKIDKCIELVSAKTLSGFQKPESFSSTLKFCGNPLRQLMAFDFFTGRIFIAQDYKTNGIARNCISTLYLKTYKDITPCMSLGLLLDNDPFVRLGIPVYLQYDHLSQSLIVIRFDQRQSLVATVLDTTNKLLTAKYSLLFRSLASAWLLSSEETDQSLIILGNKTPYAGTIHAINLSDARDIRIASKDKYFYKF